MRTFAMSLAGAMDFVIAAVFVTYATQPFAASFMVVIGGIAALFGVVGLASVAWARARTTAWFWLVATALGGLVLLFDGFYAPYALAHPADALSFVTTLIALVAGILAVVAGLTAWLEVRRGRPSWQAGGRAGSVVVGLAGLVVGACLTSVAAAASTGHGMALSAPPSSTALLTAQDTRFSNGLDATPGEVLGVFVTNRDGYAHAFDVDELGIHVPLPAGSTTFVAIKSATVGSVQFYCSVPGHRDAGMVGTITVR
jgi:uncharacterized membrane protein HdeD (DUF308 family)